MARFIVQRTLRDFLQETEDAISSGRIDTALANCQTIFASFPESLEAQRLLGEVYLAQGRLEEALHAFDWVLTNDPENVIAYCDRAMVSDRMSDVDTALDCYQQAYELSRGNGQIRQEFTQLSTKVGQQGFVFSRAGLARLYMRGDLLPQAIQELEAVLAATPDRLDARTGLLEAYWREGSLDRAGELATKILQDVPGCLKALLLLAHVTASKDMARAQTLLRQVEALDPDLVMAQGLFADIIARYPDDLFLKLLKKPPSVLNAPSPPGVSPQADSAIPAAKVDTASSLYGEQLPQLPIPEMGVSGSPGTPSQWENAQSWSNDAAFLAPFSNGEVQHNNSMPWATDNVTNNATDIDTSSDGKNLGRVSSFEPSDLAVQLSSDITPVGSWTMQESSLQSTTSEESRAEPWELLQDALHNMSGAPVGQEQGEPQQWEDQEAVSNLGENKESWESQSVDRVAEQVPGSNDSRVSPVDNNEAQGSGWSLPTKESSPPTWLSMLTQADRWQMSTAIPPVDQPSPAPIQPAEEQSSSPSQEPVAQQLMTSLPSSSQAKELQSVSSPDDDEESFFGPTWLKSLGATAFEEEEALQLKQPAPSVSPLSTESVKQEQSAAYPSQNAVEAELQEQPAVYDPWKTSESGTRSAAYEPWWVSAPGPQKPSATYEPWISDSQEQGKASGPEAQPSAYASWQAAALEPQKQPTIEPDSQVQQAGFEPKETFESMPQPESSSPSGKVEQDLVATLEELEQQLRTKGFVAIEPNSLSAIAQAQEANLTATGTPLSTQQTPQAGQETLQEPSLSPAWTELGNMLQQPSVGTKPSASSLSSAPDPTGFPAEPLWLQTLRSTSASDKAEVASQIARLSEPAAGLRFSAPEVARPTPPTNVREEPPNTPPVHMQAMPGLIFESTSAPPSSSVVGEQSEALDDQAAPTNPFLDGELETTMKRPAVRLQSMLHSIVSRDITGFSGKVRTGEQEEHYVSKATESANLSHKERLLKGYQHQLVGNYDEAMQDYRFVIRGAPELLGEVISNLRALLKLAPKYSAGYRVLGDAYMRQGEYLQAMEAYNNALTMAKKARS